MSLLLLPQHMESLLIMESNMSISGNPFDPEQIFDISIGYALNQFGFLPIQLEHSIDLNPILDFSSFMPDLLPDSHISSSKPMG